MRKVLFASIVLSTVAFEVPARADLVVGYTFNNRTSNPSTVATGLSATSLGRYYEDQYGGPNGNYAPLYGGQGGPNTADGSNYQITYYWGDSGVNQPTHDYQYFTVNVSPGYTLNVTSLSFATTSNASAGTGSFFPIVEYSTQPDFSNPQTMGSFTVNGPNSTWVVDTADSNPINNGVGVYYFRIYNTSNLPDYYSWNLDNVDLNGSVSSIPEPAGIGIPILAAAGLALCRVRRPRPVV